MKPYTLIVVFFGAMLSCSSRQTYFLDGAYIGMSIGEYQKAFNKSYILKSTASKVVGTLKPTFAASHLSALSLSVADISDYDTAYTVYELGNDFSFRYGEPIEKKETIWAGGSSKYLKWRKGQLEIIYNYWYDQNPGTHGLLYTGQATVSYKSAAREY